VRLAVIGDHGVDGPAHAAVAQLVKSWQPLDAVISLGDSNCPQGLAGWQGRVALMQLSVVHASVRLLCLVGGAHAGAKATVDDNVGKHWHDFIYPYHGTHGAGAGNAENRFWPCPGVCNILRCFCHSRVCDRA
jgi:hypothetical protein